MTGVTPPSEFDSAFNNRWKSSFVGESSEGLEAKQNSLLALTDATSRHSVAHMRLPAPSWRAMIPHSSASAKVDALPISVVESSRSIRVNSLLLRKRGSVEVTREHGQREG